MEKGIKRQLSFKDFLPIIIKSLLIIGGVIGVVATFVSGSFMADASLYYFTIQSNITIIAVAAIFLVFDIIKLVTNKPVAVPNWLVGVKFVFTVAITVTFIVFSLLLAPVMIASGMTNFILSPSNIFCHNVVPILAIADWLLFNYTYKSTKHTFLLGTLMPLYYLPFALICSYAGVDFGNGAIVPYFFLDYVANGWFTIGDGKLGVVYWIVIMILVVLAISWLLMFCKDRVAKAKLKQVDVGK